jgi:hypothetical protein
MYLRGDAEAWGENVSVSWVLIYPHGCARTMCSYLCSKTESGTICQLVPTTTNNKRTTSPFNVFPPSQPDHPRHLAPPTTLVDHPQPPSSPKHPITRGNGTSPAPARKRAPPTSTQRNDDGDDAWSPSTFVYGCASSGESAQPRFPILLVEHESRCHVAVSDVATMFYSVRLTLPVTADLPHDAPHPLNTHPIPSTCTPSPQRTHALSVSKRNNHAACATRCHVAVSDVATNDE